MDILIETYGPLFEGGALWIGVAVLNFGVAALILLDQWLPDEEEKVAKEPFTFVLVRYVRRLPFASSFLDAMARRADTYGWKGSGYGAGLILIGLFFSIGLFFLIAFGSYGLGVFLPFFFMKFCGTCLHRITLSKETLMQKQMPAVYSETMKELRRSSNVQQALQHTAGFIANPMKRELEEVAHRMRVHDDYSVLTERIQHFSNPWVKGYFSALRGLVSDVGMDNTMETLTYLKDKCTEKNAELDEDITESHGITVNVILITGFAAIIGAIMTGISLLDTVEQGYFDTPANFLFYIGCWALMLISIYATIALNNIEGDDDKDDRQKREGVL